MPARTTFNLHFRMAITEYLKTLSNGEPRIRIVLPTYEKKPGRWISASSLMDCPLKSAKTKLGVQPILPSLSKENNPTLLLRMTQGTRIAEIFQEALLYYGTKDRFFSEVTNEVDLEDRDLYLHGRADTIATERTSGYHNIVEFKHRMKTYKDKFPQPRFADLFQLLAYQKILEKEPYTVDRVKSYLCIINTPEYSEYNDSSKAYQLWSLIPDKEGEYEGWRLVNEEENDWQHPWNSARYINTFAFEQEIERQMMYLEGVTDPPIQLHSDEAWQCRKVLTYPKNGKAGRFKPMCEHYCHDENPSDAYSYTVNENGEWNIAW